MSKILIVEDDDIELDMYVKLLENHGYIVEKAKDGQEGLEKALEIHPDLILLDVQMPNMDGLTMMHKLREDEWGKNTKIILNTNLDANDERVDVVLKDQPSYYLVKSNTPPNLLLEKIKDVLENKIEKSEG